MPGNIVMDTSISQRGKQTGRGLSDKSRNPEVPVYLEEQCGKVKLVDLPDLRIRRTFGSRRDVGKEVDEVAFILSNAATYPLLTCEQETILGKQVRHLAILKEIAKKQGIDPEAQHPPAVLQRWAESAEISVEQLKTKLRQGRYAHQMLINCNQRLVIKIAKKYYFKGREYCDLISEGMFGLESAAEKFDVYKGYKFSTYAYWWIRQSITRAIANQGSAIRLPIHIQETVSKARKAAKKLHLQGSPVNIETLAKETKIDKDKLQKALNAPEVRVSLNKLFGKEQDVELGDVIESQLTSPTEEVDIRLQIDTIRVLISNLTPKQQEVIILRFGLNGGGEMTLQQVGRKLGISRERVRQIEAQAMSRLQKMTRQQTLNDYIQ